MNMESGGFTPKRAAKYAFFVLFGTAVFALILLSLGDIVSFVKALISSLSVILVGLAVAYLLNPLLNFFEYRIFCNVRKKITFSRLRRMLSLACVYLLFIGVIATFFIIIVPDVKENFGVFEQKYGSVDKAISSIESFVSSSPLLKDYSEAIANALENNKSVILSFMYNTLLPLIKTYALSFANSLGVFVIGFVYSVYLLANRELMLGVMRKFTTALISPKIRSAMGRLFSLIDRNFGKYLRGKIIDSVIVGIVSYFVYVLFGFKFAPVLALIAGVTNMIPFFGPFIGAVPAGLIVLVAQPEKLILLFIIILVLQQLDGNILDPLIVGGQVGLIPIFTMSSTIFFGGLFGIPGMLLGVPFFATVYTLAGEILSEKLKKKGLPTASADYYTDKKS